MTQKSVLGSSRLCKDFRSLFQNTKMVGVACSTIQRRSSLLCASDNDITLPITRSGENHLSCYCKYGQSIYTCTLHLGLYQCMPHLPRVYQHIMQYHNFQIGKIPFLSSKETLSSNPCFKITALTHSQIFSRVVFTPFEIQILCT